MMANVGSPSESLQVTRLDGLGVPTFWVPAGETSRAGLVFRSGRATEPLSLSGITHLIAHLVTSAWGYEAHLATTSIDHLVSYDVTELAYQGEPDQTQAFLSAISSSLTSLPLDYLEIARTALEAEASQYRPGVRERLLSLRHGAVGPGALAFEEYGGHKAGHKHLISWASRHLNRANAALWISGPLPENVKIRLLAGAPALTKAHVLPIPLPGAAFAAAGHVGVSFLAPRSQATLAAIQIAEQRAQAELITNRAASSSVVFEAQRHGVHEIEVVATADALWGRDDEVARVLLWILDCLAVAPPTGEEIEAYKTSVTTRLFAHEQAGSQQYAGALARAHAIGHLASIAAQSSEQITAELGNLSGAAISASIFQAMNSLLLVAPRSSSIVHERFHYIGDWSADPVPGAHVRPIKLPGEKTADREMIFGPQGMTLREDDRLSSVRFGQCALLLHGDDGYRELISENGSRIVLFPNAWERGDLIIARIDQEILPERKILLDHEWAARSGGNGVERRFHSR